MISSLHSSGRLKWFFPLREDHVRFEQFKPLVKTAVLSALHRTSLEPYCVYSGKTNDLTRWLEDHGVHVIHHDLSFEGIVREKHPGEDQSAAIAIYLKMDIPLAARNIGVTDKYILCADADIMFLRDVTAELKKTECRYFAAARNAPELPHSARNIQLGVTLMNLESMKGIHDDLVEVVADSPPLPCYDQSVFEIYFKDSEVGRLTELCNYKAHWKVNRNAYIVHFARSKSFLFSDYEKLRNSGRLLSFEQGIINENVVYHRKVWRSFIRHDSEPVFRAIDRLLEKNLPPETGEKCAAFTMVHNEDFFLPMWIQYYGKNIALEDLYILDHKSTDTSMGCLPSAVKAIELDWPVLWDERWRLGVVKYMQRSLLRHYRAVIFTDVDEMVVPDPRHHESLAAYLDTFAGQYARCQGVLVCQDEVLGGSLDPEAPLFEQRYRYKLSIGPSKVSLASEPVEWTEGFHFTHNVDLEPDPELLLFHLHFMDYEVARKRHFARIGLTIDGSDFSAHNKVTTEKEFREFFKGRISNCRDMPEGWRRIFKGRDMREVQRLRAHSSGQGITGSSPDCS